MARHRTRRWRAAALLAAPLALLAAACADDDEEGTDTGGETTEGEGGSDGGGEGAVVTMFGPEVEGEAQGLQDTFDAFTEETGIRIEYQGDRSFEEQIGVRVDGGDPPDIAMFPQPGKITDFAEELVDLPEEITSVLSENFDAGWTDLVTVDGAIQAIPVKADLKSLVWYSPAAFEENGYEVPESMEEFEALTQQMIADGNTPLCVGLGSDAATGWPMTDWIEDFMLRLHGPEVYDQWWQHEIPFDDPQVVEAAQYVVDLWSTEGMVFGGLANVAATPFADAGLPLLDGDCMMHRQGNFYAANWPEGTELGEDGQVNAFYLPTFDSEDHGRVTLSGGIYAAAFDDRPEVMQVMEFIASTEFADTRAPVGGFLSPNRNTDTSLYPTEIEQNFASILAEADPVRFDASDLMPGAVGAGTFWSAAVDMTTGTPVEEALAAVEASFPSD